MRAIRGDDEARENLQQRRANMICQDAMDDAKRGDVSGALERLAALSAELDGLPAWFAMRTAFSIRRDAKDYEGAANMIPVMLSRFPNHMTEAALRQELE